MTNRICSIDGCGNKHLSKGLCNKHYLRNKIYGDPLHPYKIRTRGEVLQFVNDAINSSTNECILLNRKTAGSALIHINNKTYTASRYVLLNTVGEPPTKACYATHKPLVCHNPKCINPRHLSWGSPRKNVLDKWIDGTMNIGERNGSAKLTETKVREIRGSSDSVSVLASKYGVSDNTIRRVLSREGWTWVT